ncbi:hypothetical protein BDV93DRAFT_608784 [Ceratobasidium sp. AG-I]|nr:hypothetical protein BDV93DRAFT_608784 [Ceratobasidium sp. AG-I]
MQSLSPNLQQLVLPELWLANKLDSFGRSFDGRVDESQAMKSVTPWFTPSWQLQPGFHLNAEAGFITRQFVSSSIFQDVILQQDPSYQEIAMYPISTTRTETLSGNATATAFISLSFRQKQSAFQSVQQFQSQYPEGLCDYIQDYRSSTVFDIVGSVGGLFALLQSLHILLFGRPMLWGLTGAKLITPFGLLGSCSTRGFKRRLREQYHRSESGTSAYTEEVAETIRLGEFLRDYVIEFGPADTESEQTNSEIRYFVVSDPPKPAD